MATEWSCNQHGWEQALKHHIKAGGELGGFRVSAPSGDSIYLTAPYAVGLDTERGISITPALGLSGKPLVKKERHSR